MRPIVARRSRGKMCHGLIVACALTDTTNAAEVIATVRGRKRYQRTFRITNRLGALAVGGGSFWLIQPGRLLPTTRFKFTEQRGLSESTLSAIFRDWVQYFTVKKARELKLPVVGKAKPTGKNTGNKTHSLFRSIQKLNLKAEP